MRARTLASLLAIPALSVLFLAGCGSKKAAVETGTVSGRVTHHGGKPLTNAKIYFLAAPLASGGEADLGPDGAYEIQAPLKAGSYQIQVTPPPVVDKADGTPPPKPIENADIPRKARSYATSGLTTTIKGGKNEYNVDLKD